jgi:hypothetical protein
MIDTASISTAVRARIESCRTRTALRTYAPSIPFNKRNTHTGILESIQHLSFGRQTGAELPVS